MPGIRITGRYFNTDAFTLPVCQFSLGHVGWKLKLRYDGNPEARVQLVWYSSCVRTTGIYSPLISHHKINLLTKPAGTY